MSQQTMEAHYQPNWNLTQAHGLLGYNCGYAESVGCASFDQHQQSLVWRLLGDTTIDGDSTMLDVGCGIGGPSTWIARRFSPKQILSIEYCWSSVLAAGRRRPMARCVPGFYRGTPTVCRWQTSQLMSFSISNRRFIMQTSGSSLQNAIEPYGRAAHCASATSPRRTGCCSRRCHS